MAFATSTSAFGMKSSNSTGAFGAPAAQPAAANPSPFGVFGSTPSQPSAPAPLFGGLGQNQVQNPTQPQNQPAQPQQQQPQQPGGGLFGGGSWGGASNTANTSVQSSQGGFGGWGLGGGQTQSQQQQQSQPQQSTAFGSGNIFGNTNNQPQPQSGGLWGSSTTQNNGPSLFNQQSVQGTVQIQQQQQQGPPFSRTTRFNDLPEATQKIFESIDAHIQGRIQISNDLKARSLGEEPTRSAELIRKVHNDLVNTMSNSQADKTIAEELKSKVDLSMQDTIITTRIIDGSRNPQQNGAYLKNHAGFPLEYFNRAAEGIRQKLQWYKSTIEQIQRRLASAQNQVQYNPQAIAATLQAQNATFISLASKTAELDSELQKVKSVYRELWRAQTGSARDPFNEIDRRPGDGGGLFASTSATQLGR